MTLHLPRRSSYTSPLLFTRHPSFHRYPGDLGFDPFGLQPTDPDEFREMQEKELANGRTAMVAATGFIAQEAATGTTWWHHTI